MAPSLRDLQLTSISGHRNTSSTAVVVAAEDSDDLEDVRLLDSYDRDDYNNVEEEGEGMKRIQVRVSGMTCAACSNSVESALLGIHGVFKASVALLQNRVDIVFDPKIVQDEDLKSAIEDAGFDAEILQESVSISSKSQEILTGQFRIGGMTCAACVNSVESILRELPGVKRAVVALATSLGEVEYDSAFINKDAIIEAN
ncbi:hypothetical protein MKW98_029913 [Papaver atlanticum]|uniref:HMA domain-containing protein n=1 Tax=Papaver atlanticum TaxID=357466 RepID=A0AAD4XZY1_9MAGN|nr:hypothetical protein MKW98_029913 [Papaver atlanticum]